MTHRIAGGSPLVACGEGIRKRLADALRERHQAAIGSSSDSVLLVNDQRRSGQLRGETARPRHIATKPKHADRLEGTNHPAGLTQRAQQLERSLQQGSETFTAQPAHLNQVQRQSSRRNHLIFDASRRTQPVHAITATLELVRAGQRREDMPPGSAGHDQDVTRHARPPCFGAQAFRQNRPR